MGFEGDRSCCVSDEKRWSQFLSNDVRRLELGIVHYRHNLSLRIQSNSFYCRTWMNSVMFAFFPGSDNDGKFRSGVSRAVQPSTTRRKMFRLSANFSYLQPLELDFKRWKLKFVEPSTRPDFSTHPLAGGCAANYLVIVQLNGINLILSLLIFGWEHVLLTIMIMEYTERGFAL